MNPRMARGVSSGGSRFIRFAVPPGSEKGPGRDFASSVTRAFGLLKRHSNVLDRCHAPGSRFVRVFRPSLVADWTGRSSARTLVRKLLVAMEGELRT